MAEANRLAKDQRTPAMPKTTDGNDTPERWGDFLALLKRETGKDVSPRDALFHRAYAKYRHQTLPGDEDRSWSSTLLREGLTDAVRKQLFPGRFDLGNVQCRGASADSLKELLIDIFPIPEAERRGDKLGRATTREFTTVLNGIKKLTGRTIDIGAEELPLIDLKVIKLLYRMTKERKSHLFEMLERPSITGKPTMEFQTTGISPRNVDGYEIVNDLMSYVSVEIPDIKLHQIQTSLLTASKLLVCIDAENQEILRPIYDMHRRDGSSIAPTFRQLARSISLYPVAGRTSAAPLDESIYIYLLALPFLHFVGAYKQILDNTTLQIEATHVSKKLLELCAKVAASSSQAVQPDTPITSIESLPSFVELHVRDLISLVETVTGLHTQRRDLAGNLDYTSKILNMYVFHQHGRKPLCSTELAVSDCVAALCVTRHQQHEKTQHSPYWHGQESDDIETRLFGQMDKGRSIEELYEQDYIPHGISQLLYSRFCQFHAQFNGQKERHDAFIAFQIARLDKYAECLLLNDIDQINTAVSRFNHFCEQQAQLLAHPALQMPFTKRMNSWLHGENN